MDTNKIRERMRIVAGQLTHRRLGELTGTHPETVRRYMQGLPPSVEFVGAFSRATGASPDWLLTGREPVMSGDARLHALRESSAADLLGALAGTVERLIERVEMLESYVETLEGHTRGRTAHRGMGAEHALPAVRAATRAAPGSEPNPRIRGVLVALPERPRTPPH